MIESSEIILLPLCVCTMQVLDFLSKSQRQAKGKQPNGQSQNLATITYEVCTCIDMQVIPIPAIPTTPFLQTTEYLSKTPALAQVSVSYHAECLPLAMLFNHRVQQ